MPKQAGGVSKSIRVQTILEILNKNGILDKSEITDRVANKLMLEKNEIDRAVYRDLEELVRAGKILVFNKDKVGNFIDAENDLPGNYKSYWGSLDSQPNQILGSKVLKSLDSSIDCCPNILNGIRISEIQSENDLKKQNCIVFNIGFKYFSISYDIEILPFKLIISRLGITNEVKKFLNNNFSKRFVFLKIPDQSFPSVKLNDLTFVYLDLNSKNIEFNLTENISGLKAEINKSDFYSAYIQKNKTKLMNKLKNDSINYNFSIFGNNDKVCQNDLIKISDTYFYIA